MIYYIFRNGEQIGPLSFDDLKSQNVLADTKIWREDLPNWVNAKDLVEVNQILPKQPPPFIIQPPPFIIQPPPIINTDSTKKVETMAQYPKEISNSSNKFIDQLNANYNWFIGLFITMILTLFISFTFYSEFLDSHKYSWEPENHDRENFLFLLIVSSTFFLFSCISSIIFFCKVQYAFWKTIQNENNKISPSQAVGYLFIPLYSLYWIFVSFYSLSKEMNKILEEINLSNYKKVNESISLTFCILSIFGIVPFLGYVTGIISLLFFFIMMANHKKAAIFIAEHKKI